MIVSYEGKKRGDCIWGRKRRKRLRNLGRMLRNSGKIWINTSRDI